MRSYWIELHQKIRLLNRYLGFKGSLKTRYLIEEPCWLFRETVQKVTLNIQRMTTNQLARILCKFNDLGEWSEKAIWSGIYYFDLEDFAKTRSNIWIQNVRLCTILYIIVTPLTCTAVKSLKFQNIVIHEFFKPFLQVISPFYLLKLSSPLLKLAYFCRNWMKLFWTQINSKWSVDITIHLIERKYNAYAKYRNIQKVFNKCGKAKCGQTSESRLEYY